MRQKSITTDSVCGREGIIKGEREELRKEGMSVCMCHKSFTPTKSATSIYITLGFMLTLDTTIIIIFVLRHSNICHHTDHH